MELTLGQAARAAGVSKSYLSKLIRTGKISAKREANGQFRIDPSELDRIPSIRSHGHSENNVRERSDTPENRGWEREQVETAKNAGWERERELLLLLLAEREQQIADLRADRDAWREQAQRAPQIPLLTAGEAHGKPPKKRWWQRRRQQQQQEEDAPAVTVRERSLF